MQTAEAVERAPKRRGGRGRTWAWAGLAIVLVGGLALRLWGVRQGLPYIYNSDEADHFVTHAVRMLSSGTLNPGYFANPPAFTYLVYLLLGVWYGGGHGAARALALHPTEVWTLARVAAAVSGTVALWLLYAAGARLFGRAVGLLAAAIEAVAFLPVFYSHLALNDVPTLAPLTLSLLGAAGVLRRGRMLDYGVAGVGLGLAAASKYTAGIALLPVLAAWAARELGDGRAERRRAALTLGLAGALAVLAFLLANPYALLDFSTFRHDLAHQSTLSAEAQGKLGAPRHGGLLYYLWSLTWGFGWAPALAALGGAITVWLRDRRAGWLLVPAPLVFLVFMGVQGRYFGRWLMPILPILSLLAALFAVQVVGFGARLLHDGRREPGAARRQTALGGLLVAALVAGLLAQGLVHSLHADLVLSRADTRNITRAWMVAHVPAGTPIVVEPVAPNDWANEVRPGTSTATNRYRWPKYRSLGLRVAPDGSLLANVQRQVVLEEYEKTLYPVLVGYYLSHGYCWIVSGSTQSGRAFADPAAVPNAIAYYRALAAQSTVAFRASPYRSGAVPVPFGYDWSFDYYPLAYRRPGPAITVYHLHGGRCGQ
jgi:4-amino-4-deoxy-L-arabinose transferase-like glycosyltransferase